MPLDYKLGPKELCFTTDHGLHEAYRKFTDKFGYPPEYNRIWLKLLRLGPIFSVRSAASDTLQPSDVVLVNGKWHKIALVDNREVITDSDILLTLPDKVTMRSRE